MTPNLLARDLTRPLGQKGEVFLWAAPVTQGISADGRCELSGQSEETIEPRFSFRDWIRLVNSDYSS